MESVENYFELINAEWSSYDDFERKFGSDNDPRFASIRYSHWNAHNDIGYFVRSGLIDIEDVYNVIGITPPFLWAKYEPIIREQRKRYNGADWLSHFEYLAIELLKMKIRRDPTYEIPEHFAKYIPENEYSNL